MVISLEDRLLLNLALLCYKDRVQVSLDARPDNKLLRERIKEIQTLMNRVNTEPM